MYRHLTEYMLFNQSLWSFLSAVTNHVIQFTFFCFKLVTPAVNDASVKTFFRRRFYMKTNTRLAKTLPVSALILPQSGFSSCYAVTGFLSCFPFNVQHITCCSEYFALQSPMHYNASLAQGSDNALDKWAVLHQNDFEMGWSTHHTKHKLSKTANLSNTMYNQLARIAALLAIKWV